MPDDGHELARRDFFRDLEEWNPFPRFPFRSMQIPRWAGELFAESPGGSGRLIPAVDVCESADGYDVSVEMPGVAKDDLTIECENGVLSVRGEKKSRRDEKRDSARVLERTYGAFTRSLRLPPDADPEHIDAKYRDGVLHIELRKRPESKPRTVSIKAE